MNPELFTAAQTLLSTVWTVFPILIGIIASFIVCVFGMMGVMMLFSLITIPLRVWAEFSSAKARVDGERAKAEAEKAKAASYAVRAVNQPTLHSPAPAYTPRNEKRVRSVGARLPTRPVQPTTPAVAQELTNEIPDWLNSGVDTLFDNMQP